MHTYIHIHTHTREIPNSINKGTVAVCPPQRIMQRAPPHASCFDTPDTTRFSRQQTAAAGGSGAAGAGAVKLVLVAKAPPSCVPPCLTVRRPIASGLYASSDTPSRWHTSASPVSKVRHVKLGGVKDGVKGER